MSDETALALRNEDTFLAPVADLQTILSAYQVKKDFIEKVLRKDLDFGTIPGSTKPALFKPGAEKLANIYGFAPVFEDVQTVEDWSGADHGGEPFFYYRQKCKLYRGDRLVGSADGSCNSFEKKYRYRSGQRVCPKCGQPTIFQSKPPKTGFYCWSKKGGCGAQFSDKDETITKQEIGQIANPDICDVINTVLKMSQKRALVAAILITTGASDYFTQDIDDFVDAPFMEYDPAHEAAYRPEPPPPANGKHEQPQVEHRPGIEHPDIDKPVKPAKLTIDMVIDHMRELSGLPRNNVKATLAYCKLTPEQSTYEQYEEWWKQYKSARNQNMTPAESGSFANQLLGMEEAPAAKQHDPMEDDLFRADNGPDPD